VILIPGLASSSHVWDATIARLAPHYRVHVLQIAGFAGTAAGANADGPILEPVIADLHGYIADHHLKAPAVIGHSLGGLIGMRLAIAHPVDAGRLMIVDSLPFLGLLRGPQATIEAITPAAEAMRAKIMGATQEAFAASEGPMMARLIKSKNAEAQQAAAAAAASDHRVVAQALYDDMTTDVRPGLPGITAPVTILYPWDDTSGIPQPIDDSFYQSAFAAVPHATLKRIDGSYHFIMIDQPDAFQVAVDGFLEP
jgi:pimeloyl-ACP methyl ester carboxylesterase